MEKLQIRKEMIRMERDEEIRAKIEQYATIIVNELQRNNSVLINIQIEEEYSQYDVLFSYRFSNMGTHQRGILANDLMIGIIGFGCYGFRVDIADTDPGYYSEKLGVHSNFLSFLFNEVRKKLKKSQ